MSLVRNECNSHRYPHLHGPAFEVVSSEMSQHAIYTSACLASVLCGGSSTLTEWRASMHHC